MVTSKEYMNNLNNRVITREMLRDCLYSLNKRAKNARDKEHEYAQRRRNNRFYYDKYDNEDKYQQKKLEYYAQKEQLLKIVKPDCIHVEQQQRRQRIYEYEAAYATCHEREIVYANAYTDKKTGKIVRFVDVMVTVDKYYLFYDMGQCSFHTPIDDPGQYMHLEQKEVGQIKTYGHAIDNLISVQFIRKVIDLFNSGNYTYIA